MALNVLMVVSNTLSPHADEVAARNLLVGRGDTVTYAANTSSPPTGGTYDLLLIGRTLLDAGVATAWRDTAQPLVSMRDIAWAGLDMATSATGTGTGFTVTGDTHPIAVAAGLTNGTATIYTASDIRGQGQSLGAGATSLGYGFDATHHVLIVYESGAAMQTVNAPARRVGFGFTTASLYTTLGQNTFFACCDYAAGVLDAGDETAPTLSNASATATGSTTAAGSVDTDEAGTVYAVLTESATPPGDGDDIVGESVAGGVAYDSDTAESAGTVNLAFTGLDPATTYWMHVVATDAADNMSDIESSSSFTTDANIVQSEAVAFVENEALAGTTAATHIAGTVTEGGTPVEGLAVIALNRTTDVATIAQTDSSGNYVIAGLTPGDSYMVIPEVHEDTGVFYRANPAIREPSVNGD